MRNSIEEGAQLVDLVSSNVVLLREYAGVFLYLQWASGKWDRMLASCTEIEKKMMRTIFEDNIEV